jgi:O-antigen/teichoic acid export membrane protein
VEPAQYGRYALVVAGAGFTGAVFFLWVRLCLLRFLPSVSSEPERVLAPLATASIVLSAITGFGGLAAVPFILDPVWRTLVVLAVPLVWAQAWFEIQRELARIELLPKRYGLLSGLRAIIVLTTGAALSLAGFGALGLILGLLLGAVVPPFLLSPRRWKRIRPIPFELKRHGYLLAYGLPLAVNYVLAWVLTSSDRVLLGWLLTEEATGRYSVGYDIAQGSVGMPLMIVYLAAYPLVIRALEQQGKQATIVQLRASLSLLIGVGVPAATGLALLAPGLSTTLLGPSFRNAATRVIPWIAASTVLASLKSYHFDLAFHVSRRTLNQVWIASGAATSNVILNLLWIPRFGLIGAAYATFASYGLAVVSAWIVGRRFLKVPWDWIGTLKVLLATFVMVLVLVSLPVGQGPIWLVTRFLAGAASYLLMAVVSDIAGIGTIARRLLPSNRVVDR